MKKLRIAFSMLFAVMLIALSASFAFADSTDEDTTYTDTAGNYFFAGSEQSYSNLNIDNTFFWAGRALDVDSATILNGSFIAGQDLTLSNVTTGGNTFIAGQNCQIGKSYIVGNVFAAGEDVSIRNSQALGVYAAGQSVTFDGTAGTAFLAGNNVNIAGTINGDAFVSCESLSLDPNTVITGTLKVKSETEPTLPAGVQVGSYEYIPSECNTPSIDTEGAAAALAAGTFTGMVLSVLGGIICAAIAALLIFWLNRRTLTTAAEYFRTRPMPLFVSGLVLILALPLAVIAGFMALSWQISVSLLLGAGIISLLAAFFTGASLGQMLLPKLPPLGSAVLGAVIAAILTKIPIIGFLFGIFATLFAAGYVVQWVWLNGIQHKSPAAPAPVPPIGQQAAPTAATEAIPVQPGSQA